MPCTAHDKQQDGVCSNCGKRHTGYPTNSDMEDLIAELHNTEPLDHMKINPSRLTASEMQALDPRSSYKEDNWADRSTHRCSTCMWYVPKHYGESVVPETMHVGRCRRRAPGLGGFPAVYPTDWCGDHKVR